MIILKLGNVDTKLLNCPADREFKQSLRDLLLYETEEYFDNKYHTIKHTLFTTQSNSFPTGLCSIVIKYLQQNKLDYDIQDDRQVSKLNKSLVLNNINLRDYQAQITKDAVRQQRGIIKVATGGGKTLIGAAIVAALNRPTIFSVHSNDLLKQTYDVFTEHLSVPIGRLGGGIVDLQQITICMIQTISTLFGHRYVPLDEFDVEKDNTKINNKQAILDYIKNTEVVIVDECQRASCTTYVQFLQAIPSAFYRFGLSGTPYRGDGRDLVQQAYTGKEICNINASYLIQRGFLAKPSIYIINPLKTTHTIFTKESYQQVYKKFIVENARRNMTICKYCEYFYAENRRILILINQKKHGRLIYKTLKGSINPKHVEYLDGAVNLTKRENLLDDMRYGDLRIIIATTLADEGLDIPILDTAIVAGGGKSTIRALQRVGRTLRMHPDKQEPIIVDFFDSVRYLAGHSRKRIYIYQTEPEFKLFIK